MDNKINYNIIQKLSEFINSDNYLLSERNIENFELKLCSVFDVKYAVAVSSGTAALHCALLASGIKHGDEVIIPALSLPMSVSPILYVGAKPVFVDIMPGQLEFDKEDFISKLSSRTKAVIPVHLWGFSNDMFFLKEMAEKHSLIIIEDACQAHGSKWNDRYLGTWGDIGCFSMKDGKILSTGEGGFILTNNRNYAENCKKSRNHFVDKDNKKLSHDTLGWNYRLTEFQAIIALEQLSIFVELLEKRKQQYQHFSDALNKTRGFNLYQPLIYETPNYFSLVFLHPDGRRISSILASKGIPNSIGSFNLIPAYQRGFLKNYADIHNMHCRNTESFLQMVVAIQLFYNYSHEKIELIIHEIQMALTEK